MKKFHVITYLFLAICALAPLKSDAYYGYPNERGSDQDDSNSNRRNSNSSNNNSNNNNNNNYNQSSPTRLQQSDYGKSTRGDRRLTLNDSEPAYEIRNEDYRDTEYYDEHKPRSYGNQNMNANSPNRQQQ